MKKHLLLALAAIVLCFVACNKEADEPTPTPSEPVAVTGVSLDKTMVTLEIGESVTVEATVTPENATNKNVEWSVANTAIATVIDGVVTGVAAGETELTVTTADGGHTATIPVKVVAEKVAVTGIKWINAPWKGYQIGSGSVTQIFVLQISPNNATDVGVTFTSSDTNVMTINNVTYDKNLIIVDFYAVGGGEATITATTNDGGFTATTETMTVIQAVLVESIEFSKESYAMNVGDVLALMPTVLPKNADNKKIEWSTSNTSIISVDKQGMVEALAIGDAVVTASATDGSGVKANVTINVSNPATEVNFSGSDSKKYTTWHGNKFELDVRTTPADADLRTLNWSFQTLNGQANPKGVSYEVTADKATVCCVVDENSTRNNCKVVVSTADNSDYANAQVDFLTYPWIMASKNNGDTFEYEVRVLCGTSSWKFNYEAKDYSSTQLYFVAYCPSNETNQAEASPLDYYPNDIIPTSAYTLTSSDPEKLSLEKLEGKGYKLNFLADDMAAVDLTYTCGDFVQTYRINIIP